MIAPRACAPRVTRCSLGKYWSRDFFQKEAAVSMQQRDWLADLVYRMSSYLGQIGYQGDGVSRQGTQVIYDS